MEYLLHEAADALTAHLGEGFHIERLDRSGARALSFVDSVSVALADSQCLWGARSEYALLATPLDKAAASDAGAILLIPYSDGGLISVSRQRGRLPSEDAQPADWFADAAEPFQRLCRPWF
jgi:hypothetical protein